jgi:hypothetical protein
VRYNIRVVKDNNDLDVMKVSLAASLRAAVPDSGIEFAGNAEQIVLTGKVANAEQSKRAEALAALHAKKVVNMLQVADPRQILLEVKFADVDRTALSQFGFNLVSRNGTTLGETGTQQFPGPLFPQLPSNTVGHPLNLTNLLNLFIFRPDINLGATIQALQQQNVAQILAEPNLIVVEGGGSELPGRRRISVPHHYRDAHGWRHRAGGDRAIQEVRRAVEFHTDAHRLRRDPLEGEAGGERARFHQRRDGGRISDSRALFTRGRDRNRSARRREFRYCRSDRQSRDAGIEQGQYSRRHPNSGPVVPQPLHAEIGGRAAGGSDAALREAGSAWRGTAPSHNRCAVLAAHRSGEKGQG